MENAVEPQFTAEEMAILFYLVDGEIARAPRTWHVPELHSLLGKLETSSANACRQNHEQPTPENLEPEHVQ